MLTCSLQFVRGAFREAENVGIRKTEFDSIEKTALKLPGQFLFFKFILTALSDLLRVW